MIDVDLAGAAVDEADGRAGVRIGGEAPCHDLAVVLHLSADQVSAQDVISGVAAVAVGVEPGLTELITALAGFRRATPDGQGHCGSQRRAGFRLRGSGRAGVSL
jgi:hypothetical protein